MVSPAISAQNITIDGHEQSESTQQTSPFAAIRKEKYNTRWKQQTVPAFRLELTFSHVVIAFLGIGVILFLLAGFSYLSSSVYPKPVIVDYTDCVDANRAECSSMPKYTKTARCICSILVDIPEELAKFSRIIVSYELTNFFQNVRDYKKYVDENQLTSGVIFNGDGTAKDQESSSCQLPYYTKDKDSNKPIFPCGKISNSYFSDEFYIYDNATATKINMQNDTIAWKSDIKKRFKEPKIPNGVNFNDVYAFPQDWHNDIKATFMSRGSITNPHFIVWMRAAALSTFRKKYGVLVGLKKGTYKIDIHYRFDVKSYKGKKKLIFSADNDGRPKSSFFVNTFVITGIVTILCWPLVYVLLKITIFFDSKIQTRKSQSQDTAANLELARESETVAVVEEVIVSNEDKLVVQATPSAVMIKPIQSTASMRSLRNRKWYSTKFV